MITANEIATLNEARTILARISTEAYNRALIASGPYAELEEQKEFAAARYARVSTRAEVANEAIFQTIIAMHVHGRVEMTPLQIHNYAPEPVA